MRLVPKRSASRNKLELPKNCFSNFRQFQLIFAEAALEPPFSNKHSLTSDIENKTTAFDK